jgi:hypothetical protein
VRLDLDENTAREIDAWIAQLEQVARRIESAAQDMLTAADRIQHAAGVVDRATSNMPSSIRLER